MDLSFPTFRRLGTPWGPGYTTAAQSQGLLRLIAVSIEESLPLPPLLESWAADERGIQKQKLYRLIGLLHAGRPLAEAVEEVSGVLRDADLLALRFDAQTGTRTAAIRANLGEMETGQIARPGRVRDALVYFCLMAPLFLIFAAFTQIKIFPVMSKILADYSLPEPGVLQTSKAWGAAVADYWWLLAIALFPVLWLILSTKAGRMLRSSAFGRLFPRWRDEFSADVLRKLSLATSIGRPISGVLSTLARYHYEPAIRDKLLFVRNEVELGADVWQSLATVGLLSRAEVRLLETSERVGNRPWVLEQLAAAKMRRAERRFESLGVLLLPALVVALGAFVLFHALTLFLPLVEILRTQ